MTRRTASSRRASLSAAALLPALATVAASSFAAPADAGSSPAWNRRLDAVAVLPSGTSGKSDLHVAWSVDVEPHSAPLTLDFFIYVFVNDSEVPIASQFHSLNVPPGGFCSSGGCGGSCGTGYIDGITAAAFLCIDIDNDGDCGCSMPPLAAFIPNVGLEPGDEVLVLLFPATGALPELQDDDDAEAFAFKGTRYWDRDIDSATLVPSSGAGGGYQLRLEGNAGWKGMDHPMNLGMVAEIFDSAGSPLGAVDIVGVATPENDPTACGGIGCGGYCGNWNGFDVDCFSQISFLACLCGGGWLALWFDPTEPLEPGDAITVVLKPAPGALPQLPGTQVDDKITIVLQSPCIGDLNGDGIVNGGDIGALLSGWGDDAPGDLNNDGIVNGGDLGMLLGNWGPCDPV